MHTSLGKLLPTLPYPHGIDIPGKNHITDLGYRIVMHYMEESQKLGDRFMHTYLAQSFDDRKCVKPPASRPFAIYLARHPGIKWSTFFFTLREKKVFLD